MPITFTCPACGQELAAPDNALGVAGHCRFCGAAIIAPSAPGEPARLPPSGPEREATFVETPAPAPIPGPYAEGGPTPREPYVFPPTGELDLGEIIGEAWRTVTANWGIYVAACLVAQFLPSIVQQFVQLPMQFLPPILGGDHTAASAFLIVACLLASLAIAIAAVPLYYGLAYLTRHLWVRGTLEFATIFHGYRRFWTFVAVPIVQGVMMLPFMVPFIVAIVLSAPDTHDSVPTTAGIVSMVVTGVILAVGIVYVALGTMLAPLEVVDRGAGAVEAIRTSWEVTKGRRLTLLGISVVLSLLQTAGVLACCVGVLITTPMLAVGQMVVYRNLRGITGTEY